MQPHTFRGATNSSEPSTSTQQFNRDDVILTLGNFTIPALMAKICKVRFSLHFGRTIALELASPACRHPSGSCTDNWSSSGCSVLFFRFKWYGKGIPATTEDGNDAATLINASSGRMLGSGMRVSMIEVPLEPSWARPDSSSKFKTFVFRKEKPHCFHLASEKPFSDTTWMDQSHQFHNIQCAKDSQYAALLDTSLVRCHFTLNAPSERVFSLSFAEKL